MNFAIWAFTIVYDNMRDICISDLREYNLTKKEKSSGLFIVEIDSYNMDTKLFKLPLIYNMDNNCVYIIHIYRT